MYNRNIINKSQEKPRESLDLSPNLFYDPSSSPLGKKKISAGLKKKEYTSSTNIWANSVYSFNKNFIKNIPSVDKIVNKLIKSFFTINALSNNIGEKKLKLMQRKYQNLSLNRIFISNTEVKHINNKVIVTVYLFNKKKRSLLLNLNKLYGSLYSNFAIKKRSWNINNNFEKLASKFTSLGYNVLKSNSLLSHNKNTISIPSKKNLRRKNLKKQHLNHSNLSTIVNNKAKTQKYLKNMLINRYGFVSISSSFLFNKTPSRYKRRNKYNINNTTFISHNNKVSYYKKLNDLTAYNLNKFVSSLDLHNTKSTNNDLVKIIHQYFAYTNQYKLYRQNNFITKENFIRLPFINTKTRKIIPIFNYSITKLKSVNKLFALYNEFKPGYFGIDYNQYQKEITTTNTYTKQVLLYTYKLLKKSYRQNSKYFIRTLNNKNSELFLVFNRKFRSTSNNNLNFRNLGYYSNVKILVKKLNRIDRFFKKYKDLVQVNNYILFFPKEQLISNQLSYNYKINFINDILEKELLYINYLKLLSYNNMIFKNWFLFPLRSLMSKIYNKKIIFNIVNLKYIHLNSDILSQGVDIRLKNFRKNKLVEVLKKAIRLVTVARVNTYACDIHSSTYKYLHSYHNKFKYLKFDVFKELEFIENKFENNKAKKESDLALETNITKVPCSIRRLNHIQTSTINFIKFKSVFGTRLEAAGRLTKRSTASRALFKFRYKGTLKNNPTMNNSLSATIIKNHQISNLQYTKISSKTRNGSFGLKGWINSN